MADEAKGFWSSIPGILTGIAAVITAMTGLYIATNNNTPEPPKTPEPIIEPAPKLTHKPSNTGDSSAHETNLKPLVDCQLFPTVNSTTSLMSWSNSYQKKIISDNDKSYACNKTIDYRGMAHCREPNNLAIRQALHETLTLCLAAGIEWTDIEHSPIQK